MENNVYRILFNLELLWNALTLYLYLRFEKGFEDIEKIKKIEVCRRLERVTKIFVYIDNRRKKCMKQCKEIKQNWTERETFNICFCVIFDH